MTKLISRHVFCETLFMKCSIVRAVFASILGCALALASGVFAQSPIPQPAKPAGFGSPIAADAFKLDTRLTSPSRSGGIIPLDRI
jgi:hypothetical protein